MAEPETKDLSIDVAKLTKALTSERADHKIAREALRAAQAEVAQHVALGANPSAGTISEHISNSVKARVAASTVELQTKIAGLETQLLAASAATADINGKLVSRSIAEEVREAATASHVKPDAINDLLSLGHLELHLVDGEVRADDGRDVATWLDYRKATAGYLWPAALGSGAKGSDLAPGADVGFNPFEKGPGWSLTEQGRLLTQSPDRAAALQSAAKSL